MATAHVVRDALPITCGFRTGNQAAVDGAHTATHNGTFRKDAKVHVGAIVDLVASVAYGPPEVRKGTENPPSDPLSTLF